MDSALVRELDAARDYTHLFRIVKRVVERSLRKSRAGMMLGLSPLGLSAGGFLGGYFVVGSNAIVLNRHVLDYVKANQPDHLNAYAFHVLLHEYLHTLGYLSEEEVRPLAHEISAEHFGEEHMTTRIAAAMLPGEHADLPDFFRRLVFPAFGAVPPERVPMEIIKGFDPDATPYIG